MRLEMLSRDEIETIHIKSLEILEKIGIIIPHEEIKSLFEDIGATVNFNTGLVKIPPHIVNEYISKAGKKFTIYGRDLSKKAEFGAGKRNYNTSFGQAHWLDSLGGDRRQPNLKDIEKAVKLGDYLKQITIPGAMADPIEIPLKWRCLAVAFEMVKNTTKPIGFWFHDRSSSKFLNEFFAVLRGGEENAKKYPLCYPLFEPVSPLSFPFNGVDLLFETCKLNLPVQVGPMAQMGVSAPATIAGTIAIENAEILAAICITQLIQEGTPICYGGICHAFDTKTAQIIFGGPEQVILSIAMSQMGKNYGFPIYINTGLTDSKTLDAQAGLESGITLGLSSLTEADVYGHMGICGMDQAASLDMLIMQSEIISYIESIHREVSFDDETFAFDVIKETGPKGSFLNKSHTRNNIRNELWFPSLLDRYSYEKWIKKGAMDMKKRCQMLKEKILIEHIPEPLEKDIKFDLEKLIEKAKKELSI
ncbi:MAG: trimethylamine methyltransferase family protein [Candidatus Lokiarchaeota archaeon]|nr:trimethylamine methyltransferase family protein [Candidatus Lokiarchaeota archaeon]